MPTELRFLHPPRTTTIPGSQFTTHTPANPPGREQVFCLIVTASASTESKHTAKDTITRILKLKTDPPFASAEARLGISRAKPSPPMLRVSTKRSLPTVGTFATAWYWF